MLTMLFLYLMTNSIIPMGGLELLVCLVIIATAVGDATIVDAIATRIKGKDE